MSRLLVETQTLEMLLVKAQKEKRSLLLENGGKTIIVESLAELCPVLISKAELVSGELGYLVKGISSVEGMTWFLLVAYSKM